MLARVVPLCSRSAALGGSALRTGSGKGRGARQLSVRTMGGLVADVKPAVHVQKGPAYRVRGHKLTEHRFSVCFWPPFVAVDKREHEHARRAPRCTLCDAETACRFFRCRLTTASPMESGSPSL